MEVSIVRRSDLGPSTLDRLDPEFVQKSYLDDESLLSRVDGVPLRRLGSLNPGPKLDSNAMDDDDEFDYVDLDAVQRGDGLTLSDPVRFVDRASRAQHVIRDGDVLIANVRPNRGVVTLATSRMHGTVASTGFSVFRGDGSRPLSFIYLFMRSRWGRNQLIRRSRGSMYPAVLPRDVGEIIIPQPPQHIAEAAEASVRACLASWDVFFDNYAKAQELLRSLLDPIGGPPGLHESLETGIDANVVRFADCFGDESAQRLDAEYFRSEYDDFRKRASAAGSVPLGELCDLKQGRARSGKDLVATFRQSSLTNYGINWSAVGLEQGPVKEGAEVRVGDILLAAMAHEARYLGRKADVVREMSGEVLDRNQATHHLMVLRMKSGLEDYVSGAYIAAVPRSPFGMHQVQRCNRGVRGDHVRAEDLAATVQVPMPPSGWIRGFDGTIAAGEAARRVAAEAVTNGIAQIEEWLEGLKE